MSFSLSHLLHQNHLCQSGEQTVKPAVTWEAHYSPELYDKMMEQGQRAKIHGVGLKRQSLGVLKQGAGVYLSAHCLGFGH